MDKLKVTRPFDGALIKEIPMHDAVDVEQALQVADGLFQDRSKWLPAWQRIAILEKVAEIMGSKLDELTRIATEEGGKPWLDSRVEVLRAINGVKLAIEHIAQIKGEQIPMGQTPSSVNRLAFTIREPIGVVSSISAFNHPLNLIIHQVVPATGFPLPVTRLPCY